MPVVTDVQITPRRARSRSATLPWLVAMVLLGLPTCLAPRGALASFKSSASIAAAESELATDVVPRDDAAAPTKKSAVQPTASEPSAGPVLEVPAHAATPSPANATKTPAKLAESPAVTSAASAHAATGPAKTIAAPNAGGKQAHPVAASTPVPAKTISASAPVSQVVESAPCHPDPKPCLPRTQDEVWLVSTRCLGCPDVEAATPDFSVSRYDLNAHQWSHSSLQAFLGAQEPSKPDVVWVHGYRIEPAEAEEQGLGVYEQLTAGVSGDHPIRMIIFSWAASPSAGLIEDTRLKAARTNTDGYYLAWLVNHIDRRVPVNLIGYSFGARIVTGALELLAGGSLVGRALTDRVEHRAPMQSVLIAAAMNDDWLAMGQPHGQALEITERMLALNNGCDRALKHYGVVDPCTRPEALGYTGVIGPLGDNGRKLYEIDLCCTVGKQHSWRSYFYTPSVVARIRPYAGLGDEERLQTAERKVQNEGHVIGN